MELTMSAKERDRLEVMRRRRRGEISQGLAARLMHLSTRQVRRIERRMAAEGDRALVHRARGRPSNRRTPVEVEGRAKALLRQKYHDFGPTLAMEHLAEDDGLGLGRTTVTRLMHEEHLFAARRKPRPHRKRRERRPHFGELVQMDTSEHEWFEGRAPRCALIDMVDDATGLRLIRFYPVDTTEANFDMIARWISAHGRPRALYTDAASHFRPPQQRAKRPALTQIERALRTLGIDLIIARSPQAKGRVERAHGTDQDRLIKKMRLRAIADIDEANRFVEQVYLPQINGRFAVTPRRRRDGHRSARGYDLAAILCRHETRRVANDHVVSIDGTLWQIEAGGPSLAGQTVVVERRLDGTVRLRHGEQQLRIRGAARQSPAGSRSGLRPSLAPAAPEAASPRRTERTFLCGEEADISTRR